MLSQQGQIVFARTQGGQLNRDNIQTIKEVFAKDACDDRLFRALVRCGKKSHVNRNLLRAAESPHGAFFENAQKFCLKQRGHLRYFVQQKRAAVGKLEASLSPGGRARERALLVAEELALHQSLWNRGAVDGDKLSLTARAEIVNRARDQLFASA